MPQHPAMRNVRVQRAQPWALPDDSPALPDGVTVLRGTGGDADLGILVKDSCEPLGFRISTYTPAALPLLLAQLEESAK